jgi:hypothetical protein
MVVLFLKNCKAVAMAVAKVWEGAAEYPEYLKVQRVKHQPMEQGQVRVQALEPGRLIYI